MQTEPFGSIKIMECLKSSIFYPNYLPSWLINYNKKFAINKFYGLRWDPFNKKSFLEFNSDYFNHSVKDKGKDFSYPLGSLSGAPDREFYKDIYNSPFLDEYTNQFAKEIITNESIGTKGHTDLLGISYSSLDIIGHKFGPNSYQVFDTLMRLDYTLKNLFDFIDQKIGLENTIILLSSDHGIQPMPESRKEMGQAGKRISKEDIQCIQDKIKLIEEKYKIDNIFSSQWYINKIY